MLRMLGWILIAIAVYALFQVIFDNFNIGHN